MKSLRRVVEGFFAYPYLFGSIILNAGLGGLFFADRTNGLMVPLSR
jgi:hypothetical protein